MRALLVLGTLRLRPGFGRVAFRGEAGRHAQKPRNRVENKLTEAHRASRRPLPSLLSFKDAATATLPRLVCSFTSRRPPASPLISSHLPSPIPCSPRRASRAVDLRFHYGISISSDRVGQQQQQPHVRLGYAFQPPNSSRLLGSSLLGGDGPSSLTGVGSGGFCWSQRLRRRLAAVSS